ncbi:hypothetical protein HDU96_002415 [Phlyctochytrium bullatum]|nr:hypothetical protein HDU96_002415 [Phlyctochytrium bullatum]
MTLTPGSGMPVRTAPLAVGIPLAPAMLPDQRFRAHATKSAAAAAEPWESERTGNAVKFSTTARMAIPQVTDAPRRKKKGIRDVGSDEEFASGPTIITAPNFSPLRATAFSTAENYNFQSLLPILQKRFVLLPYIADDVFHIRVADPAAVALETSNTFRRPTERRSTSSHHAHPPIQHHGHPAHLSARSAANDEQDAATSGEGAAATTAPGAGAANPGNIVGGAGGSSNGTKGSGGRELGNSLAASGAGSAAGSGVNGVSDAEAFFFSDGTFVTWGATEEQIEELLEVAEEVAVGKYKFIESEWFDYFIDINQPSGISADTIIVGGDLPAHQAMLAFSSGLARSAKLSSLENLLETHLQRNRHIPQVLLQGKKIPMGRAAVLQSLGELFSLRGHLNLHSELLDSPDFCWSSTRMEACFDRISRNLDVRPRIGVFNKKLDYANELAEVLRNHLHEQHSLKLEWAIIILIALEIILNLIHYYMDLFGTASTRRGEREVVTA